MVRVRGSVVRRTMALVAAVLLWHGEPLSAQGDSTVVDRIVAVVGTRAILASEIDEQLFIRFPQGKGLPTDSAALGAVRRELLDDLITNELLLLEARRDTTIRVTEEEVDAAVDELVKSTRSRYASDDAFRRDLQVAGFQTQEEWRAWMRDQQRDQLLTQAFTSSLRGRQKLKTVVPTEEEMRKFFEARKGAARRPATVSLRQIIVAPKPRPEERERARAKADSIAREIRAGADFAVAAKRFSQDPGSKDAGGDLNWFRRGVMDPAFERLAFIIKPGVVSDPVETAFGFHIIQVQRVQAAEVQARHILIMPEIGPAEVDSARRLAENLHSAVVAGASFDSLQGRHHDTAEAKELMVVPEDRLPPVYQQAIQGVGPAEVSEVFELAGTGGLPSKFGFVRLLERAPAGDLRFEDSRDEVRSRLTEILTMQRYVDRIRSANYVEIRDP